MKDARDPEVDIVTSWFVQTHQVRVDGMTGRAEWIRTSYPRAGGAGDQDARLMEGLDIMRRVQNQVIVEGQRRARQRAAEKDRAAADRKRRVG